MERHTAIVVSNILQKIREVEDVLSNIAFMEGQKLHVKTEDCPYCVPLPTIPLQEKVYMIIKTAYEDELKDLENRLKEM